MVRWESADSHLRDIVKEPFHWGRQDQKLRQGNLKVCKKENSLAWVFSPRSMKWRDLIYRVESVILQRISYFQIPQEEFSLTRRNTSMLRWTKHIHSPMDQIVINMPGSAPGTDPSVVTVSYGRPQNLDRSGSLLRKSPIHVCKFAPRTPSVHSSSIENCKINLSSWFRCLSDTSQIIMGKHADSVIIIQGYSDIKKCFVLMRALCE